jgi:hypothetical protein
MVISFQCSANKKLDDLLWFINPSGVREFHLFMTSHAMFHKKRLKRLRYKIFATFGRRYCVHGFTQRRLKKSLVNT